MAADAQWPLQQAVWRALKDDPTLIALAPAPSVSPSEAKVYDYVDAASATFPYIAIGPAETRDFSAKGLDGQEHTIHVHVWSRGTSRGSKEAKQIQAAVMDVLDRATLTVAGHTLVLMRFEFSTIFPEPDGLTLHGVQRFLALTHA